MSAISESSLGAACALLSAGTWAVISLLVRRLPARFNSRHHQCHPRHRGGRAAAGVGARHRGHRALSRDRARGDFFLLASPSSCRLHRRHRVLRERALSRAGAGDDGLDDLPDIWPPCWRRRCSGSPITPSLLLGSVLTLGGLAVIIGNRRPIEPARRTSSGSGWAPPRSPRWLGGGPSCSSPRCTHGFLHRASDAAAGGRPGAPRHALGVGRARRGRAPRRPTPGSCWRCSPPSPR